MNRKTSIFYITSNSFALAEKLQGLYPDAQIVRFSIDTVSKIWDEHKTLIFIMASGIVVRTIAPLIKDKKTDPAVVVIDEKGKFVISLLSGHLGGANRIVGEIAEFLGGKAVITTASDINRLPSIDLWARENDLAIENWDIVPTISTRLINNGRLNVYDDIGIVLPPEFIKETVPESADVVITNKQKADLNVISVKLVPEGSNRGTGIQRGKSKKLDSCLRRNDSIKQSDVADKNQSNRQLYLRPKNLIIGIGCNSGTSADEIENAVRKSMEENNLSFLSIRSIATIDIKGNEPGLIAFANKYNFGIKTFTPNELNSAIRNQPSAISTSDAAFKATGAYAVAEPAALLASGTDKLLVKKQKIGNVTVAAAIKGSNKLENKNSSLVTRHSSLKGKIFVVGTGPGSIEHITPYAQDAIRKSDVIVGYATYLELIKKLIKDKEIISTGMTQEIERCKKAVELASQGKTVSLISSGDPGIYAMAGLVFEVLKSYQLSAISYQLSVEVIPGIPALSACAAKLGAPLMHDFAVVSLSDRLTPWDIIEKRLEAAAKADFVIVLYNPKSKGRTAHIGKARDIILKYRESKTSVGIVKNAMRDGEKVVITDLQNMTNHEIDMQTTVIIGNSKTFVLDNLMITPRGYMV